MPPFFFLFFFFHSLFRHKVLLFLDRIHEWSTKSSALLGGSGYPSDYTYSQSQYHAWPLLASVLAWHLLLIEHTGREGKPEECSATLREMPALNSSCKSYVLWDGANFYA